MVGGGAIFFLAQSFLMVLSEIAPGLWVFVAPGAQSNVFLLQGSSFLLVDSGTFAAGRALLQALQAEGIRQRDIGLVLHSHGHADHFGASVFFPEAVLAMSKIDGARVNARDDAFSLASAFGVERWPLLTRFLFDNETISFGGWELQVLATPGHTSGSLCFLEKKRGWLFSGDTLFAGTCGRLDLVSGSAAEMKKSLLRIRSLDYSLLLPGHGPSVGRRLRSNVDAALAIVEEGAP